MGLKREVGRPKPRVVVWWIREVETAREICVFVSFGVF